MEEAGLVLHAPLLVLYNNSLKGFEHSESDEYGGRLLSDRDGSIDASNLWILAVKASFAKEAAFSIDSQIGGRWFDNVQTRVLLVSERDYAFPSKRAYRNNTWRSEKGRPPSRVPLNSHLPAEDQIRAIGGVFDVIDALAVCQLDELHLLERLA